MDNHSSHQESKFVNYINHQQRNCEIFYLPVHASALNPIEKVWALFKWEWRKYLLEVNEIDPGDATIHIGKVLMHKLQKEHLKNIALYGSLQQWMGALDG